MERIWTCGVVGEQECRWKKQREQKQVSAHTLNSSDAEVVEENIRGSNQEIQS